METKHTPGPWVYSVSPGKQCYDLESQENGGRCLASYTFGYIDGVPQEQLQERQREQEANFRLLAAAPDLLEALKGLSHSCDGFCVCSHQESARPEMEHSTACWDAKQAIARATGKGE